MVTCLLAMVVCIQTSCAVPVSPGYPAEPDRGSLGHVAVVTARFDPDYQFEALTTGKDDAAAKGAGKGALSCTQALQGGGGGLGAIVALALFVVCLPVAATVGAIYDASHAASAEQVEEAKAAAQRGIAALKLQDETLEAALRYGQKLGLDLGRLPRTTGPAKPDDSPAYTEAKGAADTVIEISVLHANAFTTGSRELLVSLGMQARVRALSARDGKVIDTLSIKYVSEPHSIDEWLAGDGQAIKTAFDRASASIAEQAIDEIMLMIYHPKTLPKQVNPSKTVRQQGYDPYDPEPVPERPVPRETERVPPYALRAIEPPILTKRYIFNSSVKAIYGAVDRYPLNELQPTFRWEPWPRGFDIVPGNGPGQAHQVRYDLRIFRATEIIYERRGLVEAVHRLEQPLEPCHIYRWTVRARFVLNDALRATEWTGAYDHEWDGQVAPWWYRRGSGFPAHTIVPMPSSVIAFYPIVETPSVDGTRCPGRR